MRKFLTRALGLLLICLALAGCTELLPEPVPTETEPPPTEWVIQAPEYEMPYEDVELTVKTLREADSVEAAVLVQAAEVFESRTGARVSFLWAGEESAEADILQLPDWELEYHAEQLLELTAMAEAARYWETSRTCLTDRVVARCGSLKAIPETPYVGGFYYSREAFRTGGIVQVPEDWERFRSVCTLLEGSGFQPLTLEAEDADDLLLLHLVQHLGREATETLAAEGGWRAENIAAIVTEIYDLVDGTNLATGTSRVATSNSAMAYGTNALCARGEDAALAELEWGMFPYPAVSGAEPFVTVEADVLAVSAGCTEPQAAFDFILLLTTGEFDQLRADATLGIPADPANASPIRGADEVLENTRILVKPAASLTPKQQGYIQNLWRGRYKDVETLLRDLDAHY